MAPTPLSRPVTLITGASSGIGAALAKEYARRGHDLVLLARRSDRLDEVARGCRSGTCGVEIVVGDAETEAERAVETALRKFGRLDTAIANAGFAIGGPVESLEPADYERQFRVNIYGVVRLYHAAANALRESQGRFAITSSIAGYLAPAGVAPYAMSKAAVRAFGNSVRNELRGGHPSITVICPGYVDTEAWQVNRRGEFDPSVKKQLPKFLTLTPEAAARTIADAVERRERELVFPLHAKALVFIERHFPRFMASMLSRMPVAKN